MLIGVGRLVLDFYNNEKASVKNREIEKLCHDLKHQFNLSIREVADFDDPERCVIGFAVVIPETWKTLQAQQLIEKICKTIDQTAFARVMVEDCDLLSHGDA